MNKIFEIYLIISATTFVIQQYLVISLIYDIGKKFPPFKYYVSRQFLVSILTSFIPVYNLLVLLTMTLQMDLIQKNAILHLIEKSKKSK